MSAPGKPQAVLHETAGALDCFKLDNGHRFLVVGPGGRLILSDWQARELCKWLGDNLSPQPTDWAEKQAEAARKLAKAQAERDAGSPIRPTPDWASPNDRAPWTNPRV